MAFDPQQHWQNICERRKERPDRGQRFLRQICTIVGHESPLQPGEWTTMQVLCKRCQVEINPNAGTIRFIQGTDFIVSEDTTITFT